MNFYMPVRVYSEENCVMNHAAELAELGNRALIVTGKSSARRCGAFADVTAALDKYGVSWVEFAEVEENPSVETIFRHRDRRRLTHGRGKSDRPYDAAPGSGLGVSV